MTKQLCAMLAAAVVVGLGGQIAQAQNNTSTLYIPGGAYGYGVNRMYQSDRQIPYFAEFPPVYYSYPVPRTYGYSPYAYLPTVMTPELEKRPEPMSIINPHIEKPLAPAKQKKQTALDSTQQLPLMVYNPFVTQASAVAESR